MYFCGMRLGLILVLIVRLTYISAQVNPSKIFLQWGYNRSAFTKSDIHFKGNGFDFTLNDATASDRPSAFNTRVYFGIEKFSIPQYVYRVGYVFSDKLSFSIGLDHMKYVFDDEQYVSVTGSIDLDEDSPYNGIYDGSEQLVGKEWVQFEHSDGLNYASAEATFNHELLRFAKSKLSLTVGGGGGVGVYIPKTRVNLFNNNVDNRFHLAGFGASFHGRTRLYFFDKVYLEIGVKSGWAFLPNVLCSDADSRINHNFGWAQTYSAFGYEFGLKRKSKSSNKRDILK